MSACAHDPFSAHEYQQRLSAVRNSIASHGWDGLLVVSPGNLYYLTGLNRSGYFSFTCLVVPLDGPPVLVARAMEHETLTLQVRTARFVTYPDTATPVSAISQALDSVGLETATIGVEKDSMYFPPAIHDALLAVRPASKWADGSGTIEATSAVKSATEIDQMRHAADLSDRALRAAIRAAHVGATEAEIAASAYYELVRDGGDYPGFPPLVHTTRRMRYEHLAPGTERLRDEDGLLVELSGCVHRYHAPLTRTIYPGTVTPGNQEAAEIALSGLAAISQALRPGVRSGDVYAAWQKVMDDAFGRGRYRRHNCGHLVGYGFFPGWFGGTRMIGLTPGSHTQIRTGMTLHIFSWVAGRPCPGNYVVSDTVVIGEAGPENLTTAPRDAAGLSEAELRLR